MKKTMTKNKLVKELVEILEELSDIWDEDINYDNFREYYNRSADELDYEEDEEGENDLFKLTYRLCGEFVDIKNQLTEVLKKEGLSLEERREFYKNNIVKE